LKPPVLFRLNHRSKPKPKRVRAGSESEGEASGGGSSSDDEGCDKHKDLLYKLFEDGGEMHEAITGYGVDNDHERVLFYEINGGGGKEHYTVAEARDWVQGCEARNIERIN
jgi:hypothetical protein